MLLAQATEDRVGLARKALKQALGIDDRCVRANWMLGQLEWDIGQYRDAARFWQRVPEQDASFTAIVLEPLRDTYRLLDDDNEPGAISQRYSFGAEVAAVTHAASGSGLGARRSCWTNRGRGGLDRADRLQRQAAAHAALRGALRLRARALPRPRGRDAQPPPGRPAWRDALAAAHGLATR